MAVASRAVSDRDELVARLAAGGFVAPEEEADELLDAAAGDVARLHAFLTRRLTGEPLAWITGRTRFCGIVVCVHAGVYVPRFQSEPLAWRAAALLPADGIAIDACTGCGAIAAVLQHQRPRAVVIGTDASPAAVTNARANGVDAREGDLLAPIAAQLHDQVDVVTAVVPYVPTAELGMLQRDTLTFESPLSYDGGEDGLDLARRLVTQAAVVLREGGALLLELGGVQAGALDPHLGAHGFAGVLELRDDDGDLRGLAATYAR